MTEDLKKEADIVCVIMDNETLYLNRGLCEELGWERGKTECSMFLDKEVDLLYIVDDGEKMTNLPPHRHFHAKPLVGKTFTISERGTIKVPRQALEYLGLAIGDKMKQEVNLKIHGLECSKLKQGDENNG